MAWHCTSCPISIHINCCCHSKPCDQTMYPLPIFDFVQWLIRMPSVHKSWQKENDNTQTLLFWFLPLNSLRIQIGRIQVCLMLLFEVLHQTYGKMKLLLYSQLPVFYPKLPYKPLCSRLMFPMEWSEQKHHQSRQVNSCIKWTQSKQFAIANCWRVKNQYHEWNCVVSEFNQRGRYEDQCNWQHKR